MWRESRTSGRSRKEARRHSPRSEARVMPPPCGPPRCRYRTSSRSSGRRASSRSSPAMAQPIGHSIVSSGSLNCFIWIAQFIHMECGFTVIACEAIASDGIAMARPLLAIRSRCAPEAHTACRGRRAHALGARRLHRLSNQRGRLRVPTHGRSSISRISRSIARPLLTALRLTPSLAHEPRRMS